MSDDTEGRPTDEEHISNRIKWLEEDLYPRLCYSLYMEGWKVEDIDVIVKFLESEALDSCEEFSCNYSELPRINVNELVTVPNILRRSGEVKIWNDIRKQKGKEVIGISRFDGRVNEYIEKGEENAKAEEEKSD